MSLTPNEFAYGYVVGVLVTSVGDHDDADRLPDLLPSGVRPTFTRVDGPYVHPVKSPRHGVARAIVTHRPVRAGIMPDGQITSDVDDMTGAVPDNARPGLWLVVGAYTVETGIVPPFTIEVTAAHTEDTPLDIAEWIDGPPSA